MFDLHPFTLWGIVIIAMGTIIGTILIQRGNVLKSSEGSRELKVRLTELKQQNDEIKSQNENLRSLTEEQKIVLHAQSDLLKKQIVSFSEAEYSDILASFNEYQVLKGEYFGEVYHIYQSSFRKEDFLGLKRSEIEQLEKTIEQNINSIRKNKFVAS